MTTKSKSSPVEGAEDVVSMPLKVLRARTDEALGHVRALRKLLPGLLSLAASEREVADGRFREGEAEALVPLLDVVDADPAAYKHLADQDFGLDPKKVETQVIRERVLRRGVLLPLSVELQELAGDVLDTVLHLGVLSKPFLQLLYRNLKPRAESDRAIANALAPALDFYRKIAEAAAETRRRKAAETK